jgi:hypothetical protein
MDGVIDRKFPALIVEGDCLGAGVFQGHGRNLCCDLARAALGRAIVRSDRLDKVI